MEKSMATFEMYSEVTELYSEDYKGTALLAELAEGLTPQLFVVDIDDRVATRECEWLERQANERFERDLAAHRRRVFWDRYCAAGVHKNKSKPSRSITFEDANGKKHSQRVSNDAYVWVRENGYPFDFAASVIWERAHAFSNRNRKR